MSEMHNLKARCPSCNTPVAVKTRSLEKVVACPKCRSPIKVSADNVRTAPEELPEADLWRGPTQMPALAMPLALMGGACVAILVLGVGAFATSGLGKSRTPKPPDVAQRGDSAPKNSKQGDGSRPVDKATDGGAGKASEDVKVPVVKEKSGSPPRVDVAAAAKARMTQAAARVSSLERQRRDWLLANSARLRASGIKVIVWPNERLLQQARQEYQMARNEFERSK